MSTTCGASTISRLSIRRWLLRIRDRCDMTLVQSLSSLPGLRAVTAVLALLVALLAVLTFPDVGKAEGTSRGKEVFEKRCGGCHSPDRDKEGPRLKGVYGRESGAVETLKYSDA